jgi:hypothetical protein
MCRWSSMRTSQPSPSSLLSFHPALADGSSDTLIATEPSPQYPYVRQRIVDRAVQPWRHDSCGAHGAQIQAML